MDRLIRKQEKLIEEEIKKTTSLGRNTDEINEGVAHAISKTHHPRHKVDYKYYEREHGLDPNSLKEAYEFFNNLLKNKSKDEVRIISRNIIYESLSKKKDALEILRNLAC
jgi:hypothetical protein